MGKVQRFLEDKILPIASKMAGQRHLLALRDAMILTMPLMIVSSIFIIIAQFPSTGYQTFMLSIFGDGWKTWETTIVRPATMNLIAIVAVIGVAYNLAKSYRIAGLQTGFISLATYLVITPLTAENAWDPSFFGSKGLFVALLIGLLTAEVYRFFIQKNITVKMPASVPPAISESFQALLPAVAIITCAVISRLLISFTSFGTVQNFIWTIVQQPLTKLGTSLPGTVIAEGFFDSFFWFLGLHGGQLVKSVMLPIWTQLGVENLDAFTAGALVMPNIVTKQFIEIFIRVGGAGNTLPLVAWMILFGKSQFVKKISRLSIVPGIFNINEPVIFGLPLVLNPIMIIPFIFAPIAVIIVSYITMSLGIFPAPVGIDLPWTTPIFISGFLATNGSIMGIVAQLVNFLVSFAIWAPFISIYDKQKLKEEQLTQS